MKQIFSLLFLFFVVGQLAQAQDAATPTDTTIYSFAEVMPRFPGCESLDTTEEVKNTCAQASLFSFINNNLQYPFEAQRQNLEGTVVASFVVEPDGTVSNSQILRDVGGGTAEEVLRIVDGMNEVGIRWRPGMKKGNPVRIRMNVPVKFRLEELPPFVVQGYDTIYTEFEDTLQYIGGMAEFEKFVLKEIIYPEKFKDSCMIGTMDVSLLVHPRGYTKVIDLTDYNDLGTDFWYEAINVSNKTMGLWKSATYEGRKVPTAIDYTVSFIPDGVACATTIDAYNQANTLANEGTELYNAGEKDAGLAKLSEAIELFPQNANFRYLRGQIHLAENRFEEACEDYKVVRNVALIPDVMSMIPLLCGK